MPLWSIVAAPLASSAILALFGGKLRRAAVALIGCLSVAASLLGTLLATAELIAAASGDGTGAVTFTPSGAPVLSEVLYRWFSVGPVEPSVGFWFDPLAALMALVVTGVGLAIHVYAASYMADDPGYARFFACMNLFVAAMLILVTADNLVLLYLGWEGVGLASWLLIGFWYRDPDNVAAADKAFIVTRIGDVALAVALFVLAWEVGSLEMTAVLEGAPAVWSTGHPTVRLVAGLLLVGALAKSAQVPFQVWLPDAMAGPTPVSALLHAATMVTAGVYLIARTHTIFLLAPAVLGVVAALGVVTAFSAACAALAQTDIKRLLAYSTISQIGFMFAALGVGAFVAAMFHFLTHAFFKALLFLTAGMVTHACGESDITRMGGLRRSLPRTALLALAGAAALAGIPLVTSGFYSKEAILTASFGPPLGQGSPLIWTVLAFTAGLTALYAFRWWFLIFAGDEGDARVEHRPGVWMTVACTVLAAGAILVGFVETPSLLGGIHLLPDFLEPVFRVGGHGPAVPIVLQAATEHPATGSLELALLLIASAISLAGVLLAYRTWILETGWTTRLRSSGPGRLARRMWSEGWHADAIYEATLVRPFRGLVRGLKDEPVDRLVDAGVVSTRGAHLVLSLTQSGRLRTYLAVLILGAALLLGAWWWR